MLLRSESDVDLTAKKDEKLLSVRLFGCDLRLWRLSVLENFILSFRFSAIFLFCHSVFFREKGRDSVSDGHARRACFRGEGLPLPRKGRGHGFKSKA